MATKKKLKLSVEEIHLELFKALLSNESVSGSGGWDRMDGRGVERAWSNSMRALDIFLDKYGQPLKLKAKDKPYFI